MSKFNHRIVKMFRPDASWVIRPKNYINPSDPRDQYSYRWSYSRWTNESEAMAEAQKIIKFSQAVYIYPPQAQRGEFIVLTKDGRLKEVIPTKRATDQ